MSFTLTLITVATMLLYVIPGFLMMKAKMFGEDATRTLSKILMFVCQPCFAVYAFNQLDFSWHFLGQVLVFMALIILLQLLVIGAFALLYKKRFDEVKYRICTIASAFGNCVFFGAPVLEALLPHFPEAIVFANAYAVAMNLLGWTVGSAIITKDKKYISIKKILLNPGTIGFLLAAFFYVFGIRFSGNILNSLSLLGKMSTPISMIVLGIRLATVRIKPLIATPRFYFTVLFKQTVFPLLSGVLFSLFPFISTDIKTTAFILCACPVASIVLNFAELLGDGQETAADLFLLGTLGSIVTMPIILMVL